MAGAAISFLLAQVGAKVVCLEPGLTIHATDHPTFSDDWEFPSGVCQCCSARLHMVHSSVRIRRGWVRV